MVFSYLLALFVVMPLLELWLLLLVGARMGWGPTLLLVLFTGVSGAWLAKAQGYWVLGAIQRDLAAGQMPAPRIMDGVMILLAGALLITPGLITDVAGFLLLVPATRQLIRNWLRLQLEQKLREGSVTFSYREHDFHEHD